MEEMKMEDSMMMEEGTTMEDHMATMDDGKTVMAMTGAFSPNTLFVFPGQELTLSNHESYDLKITSLDGEGFESTMVKAGEDGLFIAPTTPGRYEYSSSENPEIKGILVVES